MRDALPPGRGQFLTGVGAICQSVQGRTIPDRGRGYLPRCARANSRRDGRRSRGLAPALPFEAGVRRGGRIGRGRPRVGSAAGPGRKRQTNTGWRLLHRRAGRTLGGVAWARGTVMGGTWSCMQPDGARRANPRQVHDRFSVFDTSDPRASSAMTTTTAVPVRRLAASEKPARQLSSNQPRGARAPPLHESLSHRQAVGRRFR
jgi:hypothetical protein